MFGNLTAVSARSSLLNIMKENIMHQTTRSILLAALKQDGSFPPNQIAEAMAILAGKSQSVGETPSLLLTQAQVSRLLNCSRWSVKRLVQDGLLKPVQLRGLTRYRRVDIEQLAAGG